MSDVTRTYDSQKNVISGLGTARDKSATNTFVFTEMYEDEIDAMYRGNWMAAKAVDIPAFDSIRAWRNWQASNDQIEAIEEEEKRLNLKGKVREALIFGRQYGGGALVIGLKGDNPSEPLNLDAISKGDLSYVHACTRYELTPSEMRLNPEDEWYGQPVYWTLNTESAFQLNIHPSRVVVFRGNPVSSRTRRQTPWGDSVLQRIRDAVANAARSSSVIAQLLEEAKVDVVRIPDLAERWLASKETSLRLADRFTDAMTIKSITNALILDGKDEYDQKQLSFAQLPEVLQQYMVIVCGAADVPATRFLSQSPAGMNATGESDLKNYYDRLGSDQELTLTPTLAPLDEVLIRSATGARDKSIHYAWAPLFQKDAKELAEIEDKRANTFSRIAATGLINDGVLAKALENAMIESGQYPGIENAIEEFGSTTEGFDPSAGDPNDPEQNPEPEIDPETGEPVQDAAPRTLYVSRQLKNTSSLVRWAKKQGFKMPVKGSEMHCTITYSKTPVDWMKMGQSWGGEDGGLTIAPGGARLMERFGEAVVLLFASSELSWRHEDMKRNGASWDHDEYQPHVTISWNDPDIDISKIEPFRGKLEFGPEIFAEINDDWEKGKG